jgi:hypothetical protein
VPDIGSDRFAEDGVVYFGFRFGFGFGFGFGLGISIMW